MTRRLVSVFLYSVYVLLLVLHPKRPNRDLTQHIMPNTCFKAFKAPNGQTCMSFLTSLPFEIQREKILHLLLPGEYRGEKALVQLDNVDLTLDAAIRQIVWQELNRRCTSRSRIPWQYIENRLDDILVFLRKKTGKPHGTL